MKTRKSVKKVCLGNQFRRVNFEQRSLREQNSLLTILGVFVYKLSILKKKKKEFACYGRKTLQAL